MSLVSRFASLFTSYQDELAQLAHFGFGSVLTAIGFAVSGHVWVGVVISAGIAAGKEFGRDYAWAKSQSFKGAARDFAYFCGGIGLQTVCLWRAIR